MAGRTSRADNFLICVSYKVAYTPERGGSRTIKWTTGYLFPLLACQDLKHFSYYTKKRVDFSIPIHLFVNKWSIRPRSLPFYLYSNKSRPELERRETQVLVPRLYLSRHTGLDPLYWCFIEVLLIRLSTVIHFIKLCNERYARFLSFCLLIKETPILGYL